MVTLSRAVKFLLLTLVGVLMAACGGKDNTEDGGTSGGSKKWTMMVYIAGDNNLSEFALADLRELKAATQNSDVNLVVQLEYNSTYTSGQQDGLASRATYRGLVTGNTTSLENLGTKDMGSAGSLAEFINYAKTNHPAEKYALVLWSHGAGWRQSNKGTRGALQDEQASSWMTLPNIKTGISAAMGSTKLDVLAFDACLMAQYEVAYELRNTAQYLVSSEELVPGPGMPYTAVANLLTANPTVAPEDFAKGMASVFKTSYENKDDTTISVVDLTTMDALHSKLLDFSTQAEAAVSGNVAALTTARSNAVKFGGSGDEVESITLYKYVDDVASALSSNAALVSAATALKTQIQATVLQESYTGGLAAATGLAIYFPAAASYLDSTYQTTMQSNAATTGKKTWYDFLKTLFGTAGVNDKVAGDMSAYITWTAPAGLKVDADLVVLEPRGNWAAPWIGSASPNGLLSADSAYSGQNFESYTARASVEKGSYDFFVHLYGCENNTTGAPVTGSACSADVTMCTKLGTETIFTCGPPQTLTQASAKEYFYSATSWADITSNSYTDLYWYGTQTRSLVAATTPRVIQGLKMGPKKPSVEKVRP